MKKLIYKFFLLSGVVASFLGVTEQAIATVPQDTSSQVSIKTTSSDGKLYFSDAMTNSEGTYVAGHSSHRSHVSHGSHGSHKSHTSHSSSSY